MAENTPTVSVIIPTYNRAHLVGRAIRSVLNQTFQDFEIIVVDDGSTDNTEEVVKSFNDPRIRYIRHEQNRGGSAARNTGIRAASGEYIAFLDSDDEWLPEKLARQVQLLRASDETVGLVYTRVCYFDSTGKRHPGPVPKARGYVWQALLEENVIGTASSVIVRKACFDRVGLFDERFPARQDREMWVRISQHFQVEFLPDVLTIRYLHSDRISMRSEAIIKGCELFIERFQKELSTHPRAYARQLYVLGLLYAQRGDIGRAKTVLRASLNRCFSLRAVMTYVALLGGKKFYDIIRQIKGVVLQKAGWCRHVN